MSLDRQALPEMLTRLHLTAIRDQLDSLLDEAAKREFSLREAVAFLCEREVGRRGFGQVEFHVKHSNCRFNSHRLRLRYVPMSSHSFARTLKDETGYGAGGRWRGRLPLGVLSPRMFSFRRGERSGRQASVNPCDGPTDRSLPCGTGVH